MTSSLYILVVHYLDSWGNVSRYIRRYARTTTSSFTITVMATWNAYTFLGRPLPGFRPDTREYVVIQYVRKGQWETTRGKGYDWGTVQSSDVRRRGRFMRWDGYEGTSYIRREGTSGDEKETRRSDYSEKEGGQKIMYTMTWI